MWIREDLLNGTEHTVRMSNNWLCNNAYYFPCFVIVQYWFPVLFPKQTNAAIFFCQYLCQNVSCIYNNKQKSNTHHHGFQAASRNQQHPTHNFHRLRPSSWRSKDTTKYMNTNQTLKEPNMHWVIYCIQRETQSNNYTTHIRLMSGLETLPSDTNS